MKQLGCKTFTFFSLPYNGPTKPKIYASKVNVSLFSLLEHVRKY